MLLFSRLRVFWQKAFRYNTSQQYVFRRNTFWCSTCRQNTSSQNGFAMFELVFVIMITTMIGIWGASIWARQIDDAASQATGVWLLSVKNAVDQMVKRQSDVLSGVVGAGAVEHKYQDVLQPSIAELVRAGHLPKGFALQPPHRYKVGIHVQAPEGDCQVQGCQIRAWVIARPASAGQANAQAAADLTRMGAILVALEGHAASVHPFTPTRVKGPQLDLPNPLLPDMQKLPVGTIVTQSFYDSTLQTQYIRQHDKRHAYIDSTLTVKEGITTQGSVQSGSVTAGSVSAENLKADSVRSESVNANNISTTGRLTAGEYLHIHGRAQSQGTCDDNGLVAKDAGGELLTCTNGRWSGAGNRFGGAYTWHGHYGCITSGSEVSMVNPVTGWCSCPDGYQPMQISSWQRDRDIEVYDRVHTFICLR